TLHCPRTWDGWQCWPDTPAGEEAEGLCQEHVYFMSQPPPCPVSYIILLRATT
ncbi:g_PROTEIN_RECEP_F2_3 domain-containing protein, partial [Caerostris extrusa]